MGIVENMFETLAENFPYRQKLELSADDAGHLVVALLEEIESDVLAIQKVDYTTRCIDVLHFIATDYGIELAQAFYEDLVKIPGINLTKDFYSNAQIMKHLEEMKLLNKSSKSKDKTL